MSNVVDFSAGRQSDRAAILDLASGIADIRAILSEMAAKWDADLARFDRRFQVVAVASAGLADRLSALERRMTAAETKNAPEGFCED